MTGRLATPELFWARITKGAPDECWEWSGAKNGDGYGTLGYRKRSVLAHRLAFELLHGWQPESVCHTCDNPSCCNPEHLWAGTPKLNALDRQSKNRANPPKGEEHPRAKLSVANVIEIRKSDLNRADIARLYGVSWTTIDAIKKGRAWRDISEEDASPERTEARASAIAARKARDAQEAMIAKPRQRYRKVTPQIKATIDRLRSEGLGCRRVAKAVGLNKTTILNAFNGRHNYE